MRRKQCLIAEMAEIEAILERATIGRMASLGADGYPYITPVNFVYLGKCIYFHCARTGEKLDNISRDPRVCFEVDIPLAYLDCDYYGENPEPCLVHQFYHSVIVRGTAEIVTDIGEKVAALNALVASHETPGKAFQEITPETEAVSLCHVVAVRIERVSGKRDLAQKKTAEVKRSIADYLLQRGSGGDQEAARLIGAARQDKQS